MLLGFFVAVAVSALATYFSGPIALRLRVVDSPAALKIHERAVPRLGGLGIFAGLMGSLLFVRFREQPLLLGCAIIFLVGAIDDRWAIRPLQKLSGQAIAGLVLWYFIYSLHPGALGLTYGFLGFLLAVIMSNAVNLIDGMDGLAGGNGIIAFLGLYVLLGLHERLSQLPLLTAGSILGFLPFNFPRAKIFMGDSGSLLIGYLLAYELTQLILVNWVLFLCGVIITSLPIYDLMLGIVRRLLARRPIFGADRSHFYDRLNIVTSSTTTTVLVTYIYSIVCGCVGIGLSFVEPRYTLVGLAALGASLVGLSRSLGWLTAAPEVKGV